MKDPVQNAQQLQDAEGRRPFEEPKLTYVPPRLQEEGKLAEITKQQGFFGTFSP